MHVDIFLLQVDYIFRPSSSITHLTKIDFNLQCIDGNKLLHLIKNYQYDCREFNNRVNQIIIKRACVEHN